MNYDKIFWAGYIQGVWNLNYSNILINTVNMYLTNFQKEINILFYLMFLFYFLWILKAFGECSSAIIAQIQMYVTTKNNRIEFNSIILSDPTQKSISQSLAPAELQTRSRASSDSFFSTLGLFCFHFLTGILCLRLKMRKKLFIPGQADIGKSLCPWVSFT